ncbi:hypothetical protein HEQ69_11220 [Haematospirillum jordaniae]|uniref:hypothetical protein n=1 Tax=Haematospirillum jordaniae TaxID=1549855 RepID=UPI00143305A8|nr:hypothetical protein [Haematospirillum jordaniae]NKD46273.1 hypothetical protein [Haematospirillum jordaniae]NKD82407.1 hypothetical protein [Haematospirillum jordaniae]
MFPMTVTIHDQAQLSAVLTALVEAPEVPCQAVPHKAKKPLPEKVNAPSPTPGKVSASPPAPEVLADRTETASAPEEKADKEITYQQVADAVTKLVKTKGRDIAVGVLERFGAAKLPDVKPDQYAAVLAACQEAEGV